MHKYPLLLAGITLSLLGVGCLSTSYNTATEKQETLFISTEEEIKLGEAVSKKVEEELIVIRDPDLLERLDRVSQRIVAVADRRDYSFRFGIVQFPKEDQPNAFALPGGPIYVTQALLDLADSDDELASVIAHEVGHVVARHSAKRIQQAVGIQFIQLLAATAGQANSRTRAGMNLAFGALMLEYSQLDELEADRLSVKYLKKAGYNPDAAVSFMRKLQDYSNNQRLRKHSYFRTHPFYADRIRVLHQTSDGKITFDDYINKRRF